MNDSLAILAPGRTSALVPRTLGEAMELAKLLADSTIIPTQFRGKPGDVFVAMQLGMEVGLSPLQAVQSVAVINGRPSIYGDALLGIVMASAAFEDISEEVVKDGPAPEQNYAVCSVTRKGGKAPTTWRRT